MIDQDFTPEERKALRRIIREAEERWTKEARAKAAKLQREVLLRYGITPQRGEQPRDDTSGKS
jgi:hypothetical protein